MELAEAALAMLTALVDEIVTLSQSYGVKITAATVVRIEQFAWSFNLGVATGDGAGQEFLDKVAAQAARLHPLVG